MAELRSNDEFFQAVESLIAALEAGGRADAAAGLKEGRGSLNGLTDGWALFLEAIDRVQASHGKTLPRTQQQALRSIRAAVRAAVRRR